MTSLPNNQGNLFPKDIDAAKLPSVADERSEPRITMLLRTAKLIADGREYLCIVRDVSSTGVKLQLFHSLPTDRALFLETSNGDRYALNQVWNDGKFAGFSFAEKVDLGRLIKDPHGEFPKRQVRLRKQLRGSLLLDSGPVDITFENISQQGACIECDSFLAIDQKVIIEAKDLPRLVAKVRWRKRPFYGLIFEQTFRLEELAQRLAD